MFDYETLKLTWWVLIGVLLIGFALTDGFDLGAAALMPFVGKTDSERRVVINTIAPHWDGNQVWLITAGGALFAAWPLVYGVSFGNLLLGVPFELDSTLRSSYQGNFWQLLSPFGLLAGLVSLSMLLLHGGTLLMMRTDGDVARRSRRAVQLFALLFLLCFSGARLWLWLGYIQGLVISSGFDANAGLNPLSKSVVTGNPGWLANYTTYPLSQLA